ncbi:MAG TPA: hypothetical protein VNT01_09720 [Symbiobacteriaceae bacterium]|nr:hypothetical protein [Symbiobacteriaceae bacterium]
MQWLFVIIMVAALGWALWRAYEVYSFKKLIGMLDGEITEANLRRVLDRLTTHNVPNARQYWTQLRTLEARVANTREVGSSLKAEFKTLIDAKANQY